MTSAEAISMRLEEGDHRNDVTDAAVSSDGSDMARVISRERVSRILSFDGRIVAIYSPLGLGRD